VGKQNSTLEFPTISKNNMANVRLYNGFILIEKLYVAMVLRITIQKFND